MINGLGEIREFYETGWSSGSDDEDDWVQPVLVHDQCWYHRNQINARV
jgi:hypothetical protein